MTEAPSLRLPVRALWSVPAAGAFIAIAEVLTQSSNQGAGVLDVVLGLCSGALVGLWPAVFLVPVALLAARRERTERWLARLDIWLTSPAPAIAALCVGLVVVFVAIAPLVELFISVSRARPVDYPQTQARLWTAGLLAAIPTAFVALIGGMRLLERTLARLEDKPAVARWLTRGCVAVFAGICVAHLVSGPFFVYLGAKVAFGLLAAVAVCAAIWLPREASTPAAMGAHLGGLALVVVLGVVGLRQPTTRALLLHDAKVFAHFHDTALAGFDTDGDGSLPPWLGGGDCDDDDPDVAPWHVERPGNGVDDDCRGGDLEPAQPEPATAPSGDARPPVFLITIDTLRLDRTELGGYDRQTMPALAAYARANRWYPNARAPANHTFFSMVSLLAGQTPERMLVPGDRGGVGKIAFRTWLPARMQQLGYATIAVNPPLILDGKLPPEQLRFEHIEAGRYDFAGKNKGTTARQVTDDVVRILDRDPGDRPIFAWVHYMDPHASHEAPLRFTGAPDRDAYDNELSWVDMHLARLLAFVDARYPGAIVVVTSDHGEEFGERGNFGHGFTLADSELRVPLILAGPGVDAGTEPRPVSTVGVAPTILQLLGQPISPRMSPARLLADDPDDDLGPVLAANPAYLWNEARMEIAVIADGWKLVHGRMRNTWLLYDLDADPGETRNLAADEPERLATMRAALDEAIDGERRLSGD